MRWSLILTIFIDLDRRCFERSGCLGDFWRRWEPAQLVHGDGEVGARRRLNLVAVDLDEGVVEVADDAVPTLLVAAPAPRPAAAPAFAAASASLRCRARSAFLASRSMRWASVSPSMGALSLLIMKIPPKNPMGGVTLLVRRSMTVSATVSVEPSDSVAGSCSRIGSKESSSS